MAVHLFAGSLRFLDVVPRSRWLSAAGGVSVAYVFGHLLPELSEARQQMIEQGQKLLAKPEVDVYLIALGGLVIYYALERFVRRHHPRGGTGAEVRADDRVFQLHIASFAVYNGLIGYVLGTRTESVLWYTVAMALHFLVTDYGLRKDHPGAYQRVGRWIVSVAVLAGWAIARAGGIRDIVPLLITAFLGGGVILNVMKEELPEARQSRMLPFVGGAIVYAALLLLK